MRKARFASLVLLALAGAVAVTMLVLVALIGWTDTRDQVNRSIDRAEVFVWSHAPWALRLVAPSSSAAEREVWRFLLEELSRSPNGAPLIIGVDSVTRWPELPRNEAQYLYDRITEGSPNDPGDRRFAFAVHDFIVKNSRPVELSRSFVPPNVRVIPLRKFSADTEGREGWRRFVQRNGTMAWVSFSRVGFTPRGERALIYLQMECGELCGHGAYYALERQGTAWRIVGEHVEWVS